ncbi:hypothetical protein Cni_G05102 [Canna indica]|uniref:Uncharacterized protein n=1 Tax=Canna indica TaxID=4628 RepID=A0AAQ3JYF8_9LILI|nr:hypothetical protein Cni_G05102 [Canna indica]
MEKRRPEEEAAQGPPPPRALKRRHGVCEASCRRKGRRQSSRVAVRWRVRTLQRLVPGGRRLQPEQLFSRTADYIFQLRLQVHLLRALSKLYHLP